jgi:hypothetical protein
VQIVVPLAAPAAIILGILVLIEMTGPVLAERQAGGTPWHAHHIAERHVGREAGFRSVNRCLLEEESRQHTV